MAAVEVGVTVVGIEEVGAEVRVIGDNDGVEEGVEVVSIVVGDNDGAEEVGMLEGLSVETYDCCLSSQREELGIKKIETKIIFTNIIISLTHCRL